MLMVAAIFPFMALDGDREVTLYVQFPSTKNGAPET
jgi:hypothetical protein